MQRYFIDLEKLQGMALTDDLAFFSAENLEAAKEAVLAALTPYESEQEPSAE